MRVAKREEINQEIQTLKLRDSFQKGDDGPITGKATNPDKKAEAAWMALKKLNSGKGRSIDSEHARAYVQEASQFRFAQAYPILALVIESEVHHYKDTKEASTHLKPLFKACVTSAEMAFRISARMQSVESAHHFSVSAKVAEDGSLVQGGEREKAFQKIRTWVKNEAKEFIHLCDPYFGPEDLDLVNLIRLESQEIPIAILTSKKHQNDEGVPVPWEEAYQAHWRLEITEMDPGEVRIVIMGSKDTGALPIHDRWMVSASSGLRLGSSLNSIGIKKASEVSNIDEKDLPAIQTLVRKFLGGIVKTETGEKLLPNSFYLAN